MATKQTKFKPSRYQQAIYDFMENGQGNAVIDAVAGSGKSTTIVNALKLIPKDKRVLFLAFNKSIVEELKIKIGNMDNVNVCTLHSLGCQAMIHNYHSRIDERKYNRWLNDGIKIQYLHPDRSLDDDDKEEWKRNIRTLMDLGRANLVEDADGLMALAMKHDLFLRDNETLIAETGIKYGKANKQTIDFTDMIYLPCVCDVKMSQYDWVFIDECQDLNAAQRTMFLKCRANEGRFIAVGDPRQAIYGFAGADVQSFNLLKSLPNTVSLPLSVCYRCDSSIIELAKSIVPQIEARDNAPEGEVLRGVEKEEVKDGDMILCRVTAPLVDMCINYITAGVKAYVKGRDIGSNLIKMVENTGKPTIKGVTTALYKELNTRIKKVMQRDGITEKEARETSGVKSYQDKVECIECLSNGLADAEALVNRIRMIFDDDRKNGICLSTVHKSKGLESDNVYILREDKFLLKRCMEVEWMAEQERNLVYVAYTRAKHRLAFLKE